jgi:hypothetical protein
LEQVYNSAFFIYPESVYTKIIGAVNDYLVRYHLVWQILFVQNLGYCPMKEGSPDIVAIIISGKAVNFWLDQTELV